MRSLMQYNVGPLSEAEYLALAWCGARYDSANILWSHCHEDEDGEHWIVLPEREAWRYQEALKAEGTTVPTCVGGELGEKLADLYESII